MTCDQLRLQLPGVLLALPLRWAVASVLAWLLVSQRLWDLDWQHLVHHLLLELLEENAWLDGLNPKQPKVAGLQNRLVLNVGSAAGTQTLGHTNASASESHCRMIPIWMWTSTFCIRSWNFYDDMDK